MHIHNNNLTFALFVSASYKGKLNYFTVISDAFIGQSLALCSQQVFAFQGIALKMLASFVSKVKKEQRDVARILLLCKSQLIPLYTRAGFVLNGKSDVEHGNKAAQVAFTLLIYFTVREELFKCTGCHFINSPRTSRIIEQKRLHGLLMYFIILIIIICNVFMYLCTIIIS